MEGYESRLILISDAGLNTGVTDEASVLKQITDYANEGIGLTAIGLGLNFNQKLSTPSRKKPRRQLPHIHFGKDMFRYFESFDFLVTPVAYNLKVALEFLEPTVETYGVPQKRRRPGAGADQRPDVVLQRSRRRDRAGVRSELRTENSD
ncbi:MAG: hypothetical protein R3B54_00155 [Bdellovibrionota bacterium]